jgi:hypothetical protein
MKREWRVKYSEYAGSIERLHAFQQRFLAMKTKHAAVAEFTFFRNPETDEMVFWVEARK